MGSPIPRPDDLIAQVVVVCRANIARSPLAMVLLEAEATRRLGPAADVWVRSAGVAALDGQPAAAGSHEQATTRGLDLSTHRASQLTRDDVAEADLVVTMSERQRGHAIRLHPPAIHWTFTLPELARLCAVLEPRERSGPLRDHVRQVVRAASAARPRVARPPEAEDVVDPYGGPADGYDAMAGRIESAIAEVAAHLFGRAS